MKHASYQFASMCLGVVGLVLCTTVTFQHLVQLGRNFFFPLFLFFSGHQCAAVCKWWQVIVVRRLFVYVAHVEVWSFVKKPATFCSQALALCKGTRHSSHKCGVAFKVATVVWCMIKDSDAGKAVVLNSNGYEWYNKMRISNCNEESE